MEFLGTWGRQTPLGSGPGEAAWLGRWAALSLGLHGLLLAGILFLHVAPPTPRDSSLRVKLLTEAREAPPPLPPPLAPHRPRPPASPRIAPRVRKLFAAPPGVTTRPAEPVPVAKEQAPSPEDAAPMPIVTTPPGSPGENGKAQGSAALSGPPGAGQSDVARIPPGPATSVPETAPVPAAPKPEVDMAGIFLIPAGSGSGLGRDGIGTSNRGSGFAGGGTDKEGQGAGKDAGGGSGKGAAKGGGSGMASSGGGLGGNGDIGDLLQSIRRRIERAKTYPDAARRAGMEGTVEVRFRIGREGSAEGLEIVHSSGYPELDEIAMQTIRRAGPYPAVSGRIRIPLSYRLDR